MIKNKLIVFLLISILVTLGLKSYAQVQTKDSLLQVIQTSKDDSNKVNALLEISNYYFEEKKDTFEKFE